MLTSTQHYLPPPRFFVKVLVREKRHPPVRVLTYYMDIVLHHTNTQRPWTIIIVSQLAVTDDEHRVPWWVTHRNATSLW